MIKNKLLQYRLNSGFKLSKDFAKYLGVSSASYSQWETNKVQMPLDKLVKIWIKIREKYPDINIQDLIEYKDLINLKDE